jgi:hypothetical protein
VGGVKLVGCTCLSHFDVSMKYLLMERMRRKRDDVSYLREYIEW